MTSYHPTFSPTYMFLPAMLVTCAQEVSSHNFNDTNEQSVTSDQLILEEAPVRENAHVADSVKLCKEILLGKYRIRDLLANKFFPTSSGEQGVLICEATIPAYPTVGGLTQDHYHIVEVQVGTMAPNYADDTDGMLRWTAIQDGGTRNYFFEVGDDGDSSIHSYDDQEGQNNPANGIFDESEVFLVDLRVADSEKIQTQWEFIDRINEARNAFLNGKMTDEPTIPDYKVCL